MQFLQSFPVPLQTVLLLTASNVFMTFPWSGHLKNMASFATQKTMDQRSILCTNEPLAQTIAKANAVSSTVSACGEEGSGPVRQRGTKPASRKQEENNGFSQI